MVGPPLFEFAMFKDPSMVFQRMNPWFFFAVAPFLTMPALAVEKSWTAGVYASSEYDDNVARVSSNTKSDIVHSLGVTLGGGVRSDRHTLTATYDFSKDFYRQNSFKDRTNLTGSFGLRSMLLEQRLYWVLNHSRSTALANSRFRDTPDNLEERSSLSTGPQFYLHLTERDSFNYSAQYSKTDLEESSENENYNVAHTANWSRILSDITKFNLSASHAETRFDGNKDNNYDRSSASLGASKVCGAKMGEEDVSGSVGSAASGIEARSWSIGRTSLDT